MKSAEFAFKMPPQHCPFGHPVPRPSGRVFGNLCRSRTRPSVYFFPANFLGLPRHKSADWYNLEWSSKVDDEKRAKASESRTGSTKRDLLGSGR